MRGKVGNRKTIADYLLLIPNVQTIATRLSSPLPVSKSPCHPSVANLKRNNIEVNERLMLVMVVILRIIAFGFPWH